MNFNNIINWISLNWDNIISIVLYIIAIASIYVKITPNKEDDKLVAKINKFISEVLALNPPKKK